MCGVVGNVDIMQAIIKELSTNSYSHFVTNQQVKTNKEVQRQAPSFIKNSIGNNNKKKHNNKNYVGQSR